jgi:transposase
VEGHTLPEVAEQSEISLATVKRWIAEVDEAVEAVDAAE